MSRTVIILLSCFILFSLVFAFKRYHYYTVDGDLPAIVMAHKAYQTVMHDPFGMNVLLHDSVYPATNRYFAHLAMSTYFLNAPGAWQTFVSPVNSVYYACAFAKTFFQFFILWLLAMAITGKVRPWHPSALLVIALLLPLFQITGYNRTLGIIDVSITYVFFYAGAFSLVLLFFLPFFRKWYHGTAGRVFILPMLALAVILSFNGPLNAAVILVFCPLLLFALFATGFFRNSQTTFVQRVAGAFRQMPTRLSLIFLFAIALAAYSLYLGKFNQENTWETLPIAERYARLPKGLWLMLTEKLGWPLLLFMILVNSLWMNRLGKDEDARKIFVVLRWVGLFTLIYVLVLPLGGYRNYRPYIVRMDTLLPVTIAAFLFYGLSSYYLLRRLNGLSKKFYAAVILIFSTLFVFADLDTPKENRCEKEALEFLAASPDTLVLLRHDCNVLSWGKVADYRDSEVKGELLYRWGVTPNRKLFYQD